MMENDTGLTFPAPEEPAPAFKAESTHGPIKLSDLKGKWMLMFSHSADFTPVFKTEFIAFSALLKHT